MMKHRAVMFLLVTALSAGACGGGKDNADPTTTTGPPGSTTVPGSTTSTTPGTDPVLIAKAKAAVMQPADFPTGFDPQPEEPGQGLSIELLWSELTRCLGVENTAPVAGRATSPTFKRGLATQARSTVEYTTEALVTKVNAAIAGPKFQSCANEAFTADVKRSAPEGGVPGPVTVVARDVPAITGAKISAFRITVNIGGVTADAGFGIPISQDFLLVSRGATLVRLYFLNPGSEFPQDLERSLVEKVVGRA